jgi:hypothetical protein
MRLSDKLRLFREARQIYQQSREGGKDHDESAEQVMEQMKEKYGAAVDWMKIIELILMLLEMLRP